MKKLYILFMVVHCAVASGAHALTITQPTETEHASYRIYYTGIPIGSVRLWREANEHYVKVTASIKTSGLLRLFNKQKRSLEVTGRRADGKFIPIMYQARVEYPHKKRVTTISYDAGMMREVIHLPELLPEDVVPLHDVGRAQDALASVVHLLAFMGDASIGDQPFATKIFDGKRLLMGYALRHATPDSECVMPCQTYQLNYKPLLGYDAQEYEHAREQKPIVIRHNAEQSYFPLSLTADALLGTITVRRIKEDE